jgi:anti-anti-sigma factor
LHAPEESPSTAVLRIDGRIDRGDAAELCQRVRGLIEGGATELVICDLRGLVAPDAAAVDALAQMQLTARRLGHRIRLRHVCPVLAELLVLSGLSEVVRPLPER